MGLLDDAIREHLDLKRRRGADPDEVARQEDEALGPPRTGQFAVTPADDLDPDAPFEDDDEAAPPPFEDAGERPAAVAADLADPPAAPATFGEEPWLDDEPLEEPEPRADPPEQATTELAPAEEGDPDGEDVLEETPDFLQETPEHERLWFEQRPPRDFDFDK